MLTRMLLRVYRNVDTLTHTQSEVKLSDGELDPESSCPRAGQYRTCAALERGVFLNLACLTLPVCASGSLSDCPQAWVLYRGLQ